MFDYKAPHPPRNANGGWRAKYVKEFDLSFNGRGRHVVYEDATQLDISNRCVTSQQFIARVIPALEHCEDLESLDIGYNPIDSLGFQELVTRVIVPGKIPNLRIIHLTSTRFDCASLCSLLEALAAHCPLLEQINFGGSSFKDDAMLVACQALSKIPTVSHLYLADSRISDIGLAYLARALRHHPLKRLHVGAGIYTADGIGDFMQKMHCTRLRWFYFTPIRGVYHTLQKIAPSILRTIEAIALVVALCSATDVPRLGKRAAVRVLSKDMLRCVARTLYKVKDISGFWEWHTLLLEGLA